MKPWCDDCRQSTSATGCPRHSGSITFLNIPSEERVKSKYRYLVTLSPGVSIAARRFIEKVEIDNLDPFAAVEKAIATWRSRDDDPDEPETHIWQSDDASIRVERVP